MAELNYGGQAVMEGVMMRGSKAMAVAVRQPDGEIVIHTEPLESEHLCRKAEQDTLSEGDDKFVGCTGAGHPNADVLGRSGTGTGRGDRV